MILVINPPGQVAAKAEKLANEVITYTLDCSKLLDKFELIKSASLETQKGLIITNIRTRKGVNVEVKITNDPIATAAYLDFPIKVELNTTFDNKRIAVFMLRVYK